MSKQYLEIAKSTIPELAKVKFKNDILDCEPCIRAKLKRKPRINERYRCDQPLKLVHSDTMIDIKPSTYRAGYKHVVTFIDDYSRMVMIYVMHRKTEVHIGLKLYLEDMRRRLGADVKIRFIRTDNGTEYSTADMKTLLDKESIEIRPSEPHTPEHNGTAERFNRELQEKTRAMLFDSGLPLQFWEYAMATAVYLYNRTPRKALNFKSPYEVIYNRKPCLKNVKRFGCLAYMRETRTASSKFDAKGRRVFVIGFTDTGYKLLHPEEGTILESCDVACIESKTYGDVINSETGKLTNDIELPSNNDLFEEKENNDNVIEESDKTNSNQTVELGVSQELPTSQSPEKIQNSSVERNEDDDFDLDEVEVQEIEDDQTYFAMLSKSYNTGLKIFDKESDEPNTYLEAITSPDAQNWIKAINEEYKALEKNKTWTLVHINSIPKNTRLIDSKLVLKRKIDATNNSTKCKARLCARGFKDSNYHDRTVIFAPVARIRDVRFLLSITNKEGLELHQFDVKTAFLNGELEKTGLLHDK